MHDDEGGPALCRTEKRSGAETPLHRIVAELV